jgi:hypothetical protein
MEAQNIFTDETLTKDVLVDNITSVGSAFGATVEGEAVFINARIVSALKLKHGDHVRAFVLPNYEDKRDRVRWRAIRVEVIGSMSEDQEPMVMSKPERRPTQRPAHHGSAGRARAATHFNLGAAARHRQRRSRDAVSWAVRAGQDRLGRHLQLTR